MFCGRLQFGRFVSSLERSLGGEHHRADHVYAASLTATARQSRASSPALIAENIGRLNRAA
jgi:hypothetical protein